MHNLNASPFLIKEREGILQKPFARQNLSLPNFTFIRIFWMVFQSIANISKHAFTSLCVCVCIVSTHI